jgi:polyphosphate kinase
MISWRQLLRRKISSIGSSYDAPIDARFINRELSWLDYNSRVLSLATEPDVPLLERCRFVSIVSTNLDEFYQIRVAALKDQIAGDVVTPTPDGRTPRQQLTEIREQVQDLVRTQEAIVRDVLVPQLAETGIFISRWDLLTEGDRVELTSQFMERIYPILTPLAVDPAHPFPYISNLALNLAVTVRDPRSGEQRFARVKVPANFPRFISVGSNKTFVLIEDLVIAHLGQLFPGMTVEQCYVFRVSRNADLSLDDEDADDLLAAVEMELRRRRFGRAVRLEVPRSMPSEMLQLLVEELELENEDVTFHDELIGLGAMAELASLDIPRLRYRPWLPVTAGRLSVAEEESRSIFDVIKERQLLVHHPHESFASSVESFVKQAALDPNVQSIKMTLYRTSGDSTIARHLIKAAELGKQVAVVLELKARFDEARNVSWAKELEYAGVHVTYGLVGLKTHAKCILVVRSESGSLRRYVHIGTGNYNSVTARIYEDIGYFTSEPEIGGDATELFNYLTGYAQAPDYQSLLVAPHRLKTKMIELIDKEASFGGAGRITMKMNSISDPDLIEALYRASQAGVRVDLVVRGICCLRAGVAGLSDNIFVRSILGRQLEHSRIYRFEHGLANDEPLHLIGSADMMERNLKGRVETLVPLTHPKHRMWLDTVLGFLLADDVTRFVLGPDNEWSREGLAGFERDAQSDLHAWVTRTQVR